MIAKELRHRHVLSEPRAAARLQVSHRMTFVKPTAFLGVPRVYEKIMEKLLQPPQPTPFWKHEGGRNGVSGGRTTRDTQSL